MQSKVVLRRVESSEMKVLVFVVILGLFSAVASAGKISHQQHHHHRSMTTTATANDGDVIRFDLGKLQLLHATTSFIVVSSINTATYKTFLRAHLHARGSTGID